MNNTDLIYDIYCCVNTHKHTHTDSVNAEYYLLYRPPVNVRYEYLLISFLFKH